MVLKVEVWPSARDRLHSSPKKTSVDAGQARNLMRQPTTAIVRSGIISCEVDSFMKALTSGVNFWQWLQQLR